MKIEMRFNKIVEEANRISDTFFIDLLVDLYTLDDLKNDFSEFFDKNLKFTNNLFYDAVFMIAKTIYNTEYKYKEMIKKIAKRNNAYLESSEYLGMTNEELQKEFSRDIPIALYKKSVAPEMLIYYYYSHNIFQNEKIDFLKQEYLKTIDSIKDANTIDTEGMNELKKILKTVKDDYDDIISHLNIYINGGYSIPGCDEKTFIENCSKAFKIEYREDIDKFIVNKGLIYFFQTHFESLFTCIKSAEMLENCLFHNTRRLSKYYKDVIEYSKHIIKINEENNKVKAENKKLKKLLEQLESKIANYKKSDLEKKLITENQSLLKENYYLKLKIEEMEEYIKLLQEQEKINEELEENIKIPEIKEKDTTNTILEKVKLFSTIVIVGGKYTSKDRKIIEEKFSKANINVSFVPAEKTLQKIDTIKNSDIVVFDTSYNAHQYYYKVKKVSKELIHINNKIVLLEITL